MNAKIQAIIENFVAELSTALTEASHAALATAFGAGTGVVGNGRRLKPVAAAAKRRGGKRVRRTEADVQAQLDAIIAFVKKSPASGADAIGKTIGLSTAELAAPIKLGLSSKALKKSGVRRGTKYSMK